MIVSNTSAIFGATFGAKRLRHETEEVPYLIDSDVLIDISRGKAAARAYIDALPEGWGISPKNRKHFGMIEGLNLSVPQY